MVYEKHLADFSDHVDELKAKRTAMVRETVALGVFDALDVPDRYGPTWSVRGGDSAQVGGRLRALKARVAIHQCTMNGRSLASVPSEVERRAAAVLGRG